MFHAHVEGMWTRLSTQTHEPPVVLLRTTACCSRARRSPRERHEEGARDGAACHMRVVECRVHVGQRAQAPAEGCPGNGGHRRPPVRATTCFDTVHGLHTFAAAALMHKGTRPSHPAGLGLSSVRPTQKASMRTSIQAHKSPGFLRSQCGAEGVADPRVFTLCITCSCPCTG